MNTQTSSHRLTGLALAIAAGITAVSCGGGGDDAPIGPDSLACKGNAGIQLVNGRIYTMDDTRRVATSVTMRNDKITSVDVAATAAATDPCLRVVDLKGRTVTPGLIDNHNHIVLLGLRPGYHTPLETATSFADIRTTYAARLAAVPEGAFITSIGGFNPAQFAEKRLPTLAELDAMSPTRPVYIQVSFTGPATTNTLGRNLLIARGVQVGADGSIAANGPTVAALNVLRATQTFEDKKRGTREAMTYAASLGLTSNFDMGGFVAPGLPGHDEEFTSDGAASWDPQIAYDPLMALHDAGEMKVRVRIFFLSMDTTAAVPVLSARLQQAIRTSDDDMLRVGGLGEFITNWPLFGVATPPANYAAAITKAANAGWIYQQHTLSTGEDNIAINAWEALNATKPIASLNWSLAHVTTITPANVQRLKAMGAGVAVHGYRYLAGTREQNGPPYRTIADSGIKAGAGSDAAQIAALNPWLTLYYMVTGKNSSGVLINEGQTLTREEALRMYTRENGWFSKEEKKIGTIETGKLADLVVLDSDYFSVADEDLKRIKPVMTIVGGKVVHDTGALPK